MESKVIQSKAEVFVGKVKSAFHSPFGRHVSLLTLSNIITVLVGMVQTILVARLLGPEQYGLAGLIINYPQVIYMILNATTSEGLVRYLSEFHSKREHRKALAVSKMGFGVDFCISVLAFTGIVFTAGWATQKIIKHPDSKSLLLVYAASFLPMSFYNTSCAILTVFQQFPLIAWFSIFNRCLQSGLILLGAWRWGVAGLIWGTALGAAIYGLMMGGVGLWKSRVEWGGFWLTQSWSPLKGRIREIARFFLLTDATLSVALPMQRLDITLLGYFGNAQEVGYYKAAKTIASGLINLIDALQSVSYPRLAKAWVTSRVLFYQQWRQLAELGVFLGVGLILPFYLVQFLPGLLMGSKFAVAGTPLMLFWLAFSLRLAFFWLRPFYLAKGLVHLWLTIHTLSAVVGTTLMVLGAMYWGMNGVATATLVYYILIFLMGIPIALRKGA